MPKKSKAPGRIAASFVTSGYYVTKGGALCTLTNVSGRTKGGLLLPGTPTVEFLKMRDARRAITRTETAAATLRTSLIREWDRVQELIAPGDFEVQPLVRQAAAKPEGKKS